jgi:nucleoside-diphosphate-sugar epimerase
MGTIGLVGATGATGRAVAAELHSAGRPYRAIARSADTLSRDFGGDALAERVVWNPGDPQSVRAAFTGVDTAVYLVGVDYTQFELHPKLMRAAVDGAVAAGTKRMLLVGTVYPYGHPQTTPVSETHPTQPQTFKGKMRKAQEDVLLDAHRRGLIEGVVLRVPDLYGPHMEKSFLTSPFTAAPQGKPSILIGPIDTPHEFAFIPDVANVIVRMLDEPRVYGKSWNYGAPGITSQREMATKIYAACGTKPRFTVANLWMLRLMGLWNPVMRELVEMNYLQTTPVILDDSALRAVLGEVPKTSYDKGIRLTLEAQGVKIA